MLGDLGDLIGGARNGGLGGLALGDQARALLGRVLRLDDAVLERPSDARRPPRPADFLLGVAYGFGSHRRIGRRLGLLALAHPLQIEVAVVQLAEHRLIHGHPVDDSLGAVLAADVGLADVDLVEPAAPLRIGPGHHRRAARAAPQQPLDEDVQALRRPATAVAVGSDHGVDLGLGGGEQLVGNDALKLGVVELAVQAVLPDVVGV